MIWLDGGCIPTGLFQPQQQANMAYTNWLHIQAAGAPTQMMYLNQGNPCLEVDKLEEVMPETVSEFKQLSNHKFHELLEKFKELRSVK